MCYLLSVAVYHYLVTVGTADGCVLGDFFPSEYLESVSGKSYRCSFLCLIMGSNLAKNKTSPILGLRARNREFTK